MNRDKPVADFTIVSVAFGEKFSKFVPEWWNSIQNLEIPPKEIVVVHNPKDNTGVDNLPVTLIPNLSDDVTKMLNIGFSSVKTKWTGSLSLDDLYFPGALNEINDAQNFDIIGCNAISKKTGAFLSSDLVSLKSRHNKMLGFSFFTTELYYRVGGWPNIVWSDWGFWWLCMKADARFCLPPRAHVLVDDQSENRISSNENLEADQEMQIFMERNN
jgi:hypothetical protein